MSDNILRPAHYCRGKVEQVTFTRRNRLLFTEGNVVKYVYRYKFKGKPLEDLRKAMTYIRWAIEDRRDEPFDERPDDGIAPSIFFHANDWLSPYQRAAISGVYHGCEADGLRHLEAARQAIEAMIADLEFEQGIEEPVVSEVVIQDWDKPDDVFRALTEEARETDEEEELD